MRKRSGNGQSDHGGFSLLEPEKMEENPIF